MKLILFSHPTIFNGEIEIVHSFFESGLECFHLRKPFSKSDDLAKYLQSIDSQFHSKIVLHEHHNLCKEFKIKGLHFKSHQKVISVKHEELSLSKSFHSLEEIRKEENSLNYCTLSPVFNSISKENYLGMHLPYDLGNKIEKIKEKKNNLKIFALGGITSENMKKIKTLGFDGAGILGFVWNPFVLENNVQKTHDHFLEIMEALKY